MKRESLVFFIGVVLTLTPFLGVPSAWRRAVSVVLGVVLMIIGYQLRRRAYIRLIEDHNGERRTDAYVEQMKQPSAELGVRSASPTDAPNGEIRKEETHTARPRRTRMKNV